MKKSLRMITLFSLVLGLGGAHRAEATYAGCTAHYYIAARFPAVFQGQPVKEVMVYAGGLLSGADHPGEQEHLYWTDIQHQPMLARRDHFFAKLKTTETWMPPGASTVSPTRHHGPHVQYLVTLDDGSIVASEIEKIPVRVLNVASERAVQEAVARFNQQLDTDLTQALQSYGGRDCADAVLEDFLRDD